MIKLPLEEWLPSTKDILQDFVILYTAPQIFAYEGPLRFRHWIESFRRISLATMAEFSDVPLNIISLLTPVNPNDSEETRELKLGIEQAIYSGGVRAQELSQFSMDELRMIISPQAIALYTHST